MKGSMNMSYDSSNLTTPDIKWLGVRPSDLDRFKIPKQCRIKMTDEDIKTGRKLVCISLHVPMVLPSAGLANYTAKSARSCIKFDCLGPVSLYGYHHLPEGYIACALGRTICFCSLFLVLCLVCPYKVIGRSSSAAYQLPMETLGLILTAVTVCAAGRGLHQVQPGLGERAADHAAYWREGRDPGTVIFWLSVSHSGLPSAQASGERLDLSIVGSFVPHACRTVID